MRTSSFVLALLVAPGALAAQGMSPGTTAAVPARAVADVRAASGDTSLTMVGEEQVQVHAVARARDRVESSLSRKDGLAVAAHSEFDADLPRSYEVRVTRGDSTVDLRVRRRGNRLQVEGTEVAAVPIPRNTRWAVADVGMDEHLLPVLRTLPEGTSGLPLAVFRPSIYRWDRLSASVANLAGATLIHLQDRDGAVTRLLVTDVGDLLYAETLAPGGTTVTSRRVPPPGTRRHERLEDLLVIVRSQ
jgi:hypothetical protein